MSFQNDYAASAKPSLSQRISHLETSTSNVTTGLVKDLRMIEIHVARAEATLLRRERDSLWTKPDLLARMVAADG